MANTKITSKVIADDAILTANITDANVTTAKIAADAITGAKIADDVALGGNPTTTTQSAGNNTTRVATTAFVSTAVSNLVDSSPSALNTLNELAAALGDDANFSTTVTNSIAAKLPLAGGTMTGNIVMGDDTSIGIADDAERIEFDGAGDISLLGANVGIGTASPSQTLHTSGTGVQRIQVDATDNNAAGAGLYMKVLNSGSLVGNATVRVDNTGNLDIFTGTSSESQKMTILAGGNVGIGTASPDTLLNLESAAPILRGTDSDDTDKYGQIEFDNGDIVISADANSGGGYQSGSKITFCVDSGTERLRIDNSGNVGIGTTSPDNTLHVDASGGGTIKITRESSSTANFLRLECDGTNGNIVSKQATIFNNGDSERMRITSSGQVLVGVTSATGMSGAGIETQGSIRANNYITSTDLAGSGFRNVNTTASGSLTTSTSLRELKENIVTTSLGLDAVKALTPREFDWKDVAEYGTEDIGFIADEVFAVSPKLATYKVGEKTEANLQGVKYEQLTAVLVKAIQEQQTIIEDLKARIETLEG